MPRSSETGFYSRDEALLYLFNRTWGLAHRKMHQEGWHPPLQPGLTT